MAEGKVYTAIGLMSGTSMDGIDAALLATDGERFVRPLGFLPVPYGDADRALIRAAMGIKDAADPRAAAATDLSTRLHIAAVRALLDQTGYDAEQVDVIGYHGQTLYHAPHDGITVQIGDGAAMAAAFGIDVINDFRSHDVKTGGQGAPLAPIYHWARACAADTVELPCVVLNIGGVSNVTYIGAADEDLLAFDTGPGNALMDDWMQSRTGARYDADGQAAAKGRIIQPVLDQWLAHDYFDRKPPKSLDRDQWDISAFGRLPPDMAAVSVGDGAATLLAFSADTIALSRRFMPREPKGWYVCGGGRHNTALMAALRERLGNVQSVDVLGWDGDATEAECFAYMAVRSLQNKPISFCGTTGVERPTAGGVLHKGRAS